MSDRPSSEVAGPSSEGETRPVVPSSSMAKARTGDRPRIGGPVVVALVGGVVAWGGLAVLASSLLSREPPAAGFDLGLVLTAAQRVRDGLSPYDLASVAGPGLEARTLFYSYPPIVAQAVSLLPPLDLAVSLSVLWLLAALAWLPVSVGLSARLVTRHRWVASIAAIGLAPLILPMTIGLLFGNLDVLFLAGYGLALWAVVTREPGRRALLAMGAVIGVMALIKVYPAALLLWLLVLGYRSGETGRRSAWLAVLSGLAVVAGTIGMSLLVWGAAPWDDYIAMLGAAAGADVVVPANVGPAAIIAGSLGLGEAAARPLQVVVLAMATLALIWAGRSKADPSVTATVAAIASLVVLPLTWLHYFAVLIAPGTLALVDARGTDRERVVAALAILAAGVAVVAVVAPPVVWAAVALLVVAVLTSSDASRMAR